MCNKILINKSTLPRSEDGDKVEVTVKGIFREDEEGNRMVEVSEVDGNPIESFEDEEDMMDRGPEDALQLFIIKKRKMK